MRRSGVVLVLAFLVVQVGCPAIAARRDYVGAQQAFDRDFGIDERIRAQVLLIAAGYSNWVPMEHLSPRFYKALQDFQSENGFAPNGRLDKAQADRLNEVGTAMLDKWGFRKVHFADRTLSVWVPLGLGLAVTQNASGLHFRDPQGRLNLHLMSLPNTSARALYRGILVEADKEKTKVNYSVFKNDENWFVVSSTARDGRDRYYRYHQDGSDVVGFGLEWDNAAGNINAERIAIIMSGSLRAAMTGAPFVDPPASPEPEAKLAPPQTPQPAAVPVAPMPTPPKTTYKSGTGFFVSDAGHFVTNAHVVADCEKILVKTDDGSINSAERVATDATNDLALLKLAKRPQRIVAIRVGTRLGEGIEAFGFPHSDILATSGNFTLGNVTALTGMKDDSRYLQISAPVQSGNSGGPLLDTSGNLVGVVSSKLNAIKVMLADGDLPQNVNFAVKSSMVANFLDVNRVAYKTGTPASTPMQPADIADQARAVSGFVVCK